MKKSYITPETELINVELENVVLTQSIQVHNDDDSELDVEGSFIR